MTIWMIAVQLATMRRIVLRPRLLRRLLDVGCDVAEVCAFPPDAEDCWMNGANGLYLYVIFAKDLWWSNDLEVVLFLLNASTEPSGSIVNGQIVCDVAYDFAASDSPLGSYWRDLLFCALARAGIDVGRFFEYPLQMPWYTDYYTIWHHRCLCYLDCWDGFYVNEDLARWLERQPWPGDDTEAMYRFANGDVKDIMFEEAEARWRILYTEFKVRQREGRFEDLSEDES